VLQLRTLLASPICCVVASKALRSSDDALTRCQAIGHKAGEVDAQLLRAESHSVDGKSDEAEMCKSCVGARPKLCDKNAHGRVDSFLARTQRKKAQAPRAWLSHCAKRSCIRAYPLHGVVAMMTELGGVALLYGGVQRLLTEEIHRQSLRESGFWRGSLQRHQEVELPWRLH
jgi:hypothetical protein